MNDSEIIKALECCGTTKVCCRDCPLNDIDDIRICQDELVTEAYRLINRQQAEIERLTQENNALNGDTEKYIEECENRSQQIAEGYRKEIKSEAVRGFAKKLKTEIAGLEVKSPSITYKCGIEDALYYRMPKIIDRLLEEMGCNNDRP